MAASRGITRVQDADDFGSFSNGLVPKWNTSTGKFDWITVIASGDAAGGDLAGTYPNPTLDATKTYFAPQVPNLVCFLDDYLAAVSGTSGAVTANKAIGCRVIVPRTGTLNDIEIFVGVSSGNIEVGILDTSATTRNRLWTSGSIACPAGGSAWRKIGDPGLSVTRGDHLDFYLAVDNGTAQFLRTISIGSSAASLLPTSFLPSPLGGKPAAVWIRSTAAFPIASTVAESDLGITNVCPVIIARVT